MKLFGSTKKLIDQTKNGEKVPSVEVAEVVSVQCNLVDNQYQQKSIIIAKVKYYTLLRACLFVKCWTKQFSIFEKL